MSTFILPSVRVSRTAGRRGWAASGRASMACGLLASDMAALASASLLAVLLRHWFYGQYDIAFYLQLAPALLLFPLLFSLGGLYPAIAMHPAIELKNVSQMATLGFLVLAAATFLSGGAGDYSRSVVIMAWLFSVPALIALRGLTRAFASRFSWWGAQAVVIGNGHGTLDLAMALGRDSRRGVRVCGVLTHDDAMRKSLPQTSAGREHAIEYAILHAACLPADSLVELANAAGTRFKRVLLLPGVEGMSSLGVEAKEIEGRLGIEITHRLLSTAARLSKRTFDVVVAFGLTIALAPLMAAIGLAIRIGSAGPVVYGQGRVGVAGAPFRALKFRSMVGNADAVLAGHLARDAGLRAEWERDHKLRRDPRVTRIGRLLRKTSLDELPQLWNVLRGDMSLVGPRPIVEAEIGRYRSVYSLYVRVRPGITGLWQVSGRNNTSYEDRVRHDEYYVRNWSLWLDLYLLYRTVKVVMFAEGAY